MNRILVFLIFLNLSILLNAQKDLRKGFILNTKTDTIKGMLNYQGDIKNSKACVFYSDLGKKKVFQPFDIYGYKFNGGKFYISKNIIKSDTISQVFAECLVSGQKDIYYYRDYSGYHFLINANDSSLIEIPYKQEIIKIGSKSYLRESTQHIEILKSYFLDCPSIYSQIEKMKKPNTRNLISIAKAYHDEVCGENSCIVYKKQKTSIKIAFEPRTEFTKFKENPNYFEQYGGLLHIWLPASNEKLYLKSGLFYSKHSNDLSMYKIPLQFEYLFPNKLIRPKFDLGFNVYLLNNPSYSEGMALTLATSGGFLVRLTKFMYLDLSFETDILQFTYETDLFLSHSFGLGTFILF